MADTNPYITSVPLASSKQASYRKDQMHDLRRAHAERSDGEINTDKDNAIAEFIDWAFSPDRDDIGD